MSVELVVHIGQTKAGSTSIQKSLRGATDTLAAQGTFYLGLMCEHAGGQEAGLAAPRGMAAARRPRHGEGGRGARRGRGALGRGVARGGNGAGDLVERDLPRQRRRSSSRPSRQLTESRRRLSRRGLRPAPGYVGPVGLSPVGDQAQGLPGPAAAVPRVGRRPPQGRQPRTSSRGSGWTAPRSSSATSTPAATWSRTFWRSAASTRRGSRGCARTRARIRSRSPSGPCTTPRSTTRFCRSSSSRT